MKIFLTFSHQLFTQLPPKEPGLVVYLIENQRLFRPRANPAAAVFHRAVLQAFRERLLVKGREVVYLDMKIDGALKEVIKENPEEVLYYNLGDAHLERQIQSTCLKAGIPIKVLPTHVFARSRAIADYIPTIFPEIEENRYVEEAIEYVAQLVPSIKSMKFSYPVTSDDAEEWLEFLPEALSGAFPVKQVVQEITPILNAGIIEFGQLKEALKGIKAEAEFFSLLNP